MKAFRKLKYFLEDFDFLKVYRSPFRPPIPRLYVGKVAIGTPYFFPRRWVKGTPKLAIDATVKHIRETRSWNARNPEYKRTEKPFREIYEDKLRCSYSKPNRIGFDFVRLGWKTKWTNTDYRFEWSPIWSFVFFKWQIAITFVAPEMHHYWECWLYYNRETKHVAKTTEARLAIARKGFPCNWTSSKNGVEEKICYWDHILKPKYLNK